MRHGLLAGAAGTAAAALSLAGVGAAGPALAAGPAAAARSVAAPRTTARETQKQPPATAYVANIYSNSVTPINTATNKAGAPIKIGRAHV